MTAFDRLYSALIAADDMFVPRGPYFQIPKGGSIEVREDIRWAQLPERRRCAYCASNHTEDRCPNCGAPDRTPQAPKLAQHEATY